jgi:hypothetical protein
VLGIVQGPILIMAENHGTGRVWQRLMRNETLPRTRAGGLPAAASELID